MDWIYVVAASLLVWGLCGGVIGIGRKIWSLQTTLRVHLVAAPIFSFVASTAHALIVPEFDPLLRAAMMTGLIVLLDAVLVAPMFERSFSMFRSLIGTWAPFLAIFLASWAAGLLTSVS